MVDDGSTDDTGLLSRQKGATVFRLPKQSGPASARNFWGLNMQMEKYFSLIDSDVVVRRGIHIVNCSEITAPSLKLLVVFGSYDDEPAEVNFISQYRNMFHHFHHQHSDMEAFTFWAGCGAIKKKHF